MTDYTEPSDVDIHASPETVQAYISDLEADRDELEALLNEGIATDADTRQQARNDALREAAKIAQSPNLPIFKDTWTSEQDAAAISAMMKISDAILALIDTPAPDPVQQAAKVLLAAMAHTDKRGTHAAAREFPQMGFINAGAVIGAALRALAGEGK